jgi:hypothetical protein
MGDIISKEREARLVLFVLSRNWRRWFQKNFGVQEYAIEEMIKLYLKNWI